MSVSGTMPARRASASRFWSAQASSYGTRPSRRTSTSAGSRAGRHLAGGVVRAAPQRARLDVTEAQLERLDLERREFLRGHVARDRQVVGGRPQVLADGQDLDVMGPQVAEDLDDLIELLTEAEHDAGLGIDGRVHPLGALQELERTRVATLRPDLRIEAGHRFDVVVEDLGPRAHYRCERRLV